jgi:hypothetical protein
MKLLPLVIAGTILATNAMAYTPGTPEYNLNLQTAVKACRLEMQKAPYNNIATADEANNYCICYSKSIAAALTPNDEQNLVANNYQLTPHMANLVKIAANACVKHINLPDVSTLK